MSRIYIIAELGINHQGSVAMAKQLIDAAKEAGCDAVKFQARTIELVYLPEELSRPRASVFGSTNGDLKRGLEFSVDQFRDLDTYCREQSLAWSASCWDAESVLRIAQFHPHWLKIPSALITDLELLNAYRDTRIPLFMSTGMSSWEEIDMAVGILNLAPMTLLHCHSAYPSPLDELNLACIQRLKARYGLPVGYSSHSVSPWPCLMAAVLGATVLEAHLTLDRTMWGSDHAASLEPHAFQKMVEEVRTWERCQGDGEKHVYASEEPVKAKLRKVHG